MHAHSNCDGNENANGNKNGTQTERRLFLTSTVHVTLDKPCDPNSSVLLSLSNLLVYCRTNMNQNRGRKCIFMQNCWSVVAAV